MRHILACLALLAALCGVPALGHAQGPPSGGIQPSGTVSNGDSACWNGTSGYSLKDCGSAPGNVSGPASSTSGDLPSFNGTTGKVLQDSGISTTTAMALVNVQVFLTNGTYVPTAGTNQIIVEVLAQGGGGGGCATSSATQNCIAQSGGSGSYAKVRYVSGFSGAAVSIGSAGAGGAAGQNNGVSGGTASFILAGGGSNASISCPGGTGGTGGATFTATTGTITANQTPSAPCTISNGATLANSGGSVASIGVSIGALGSAVTAPGASSLYGGGGQTVATQAAGQPASGYGAGGSGAVTSNGTQQAGGNPSPGIEIVWEFR